MRSARACLLLELELRISTLDFCVVIVDVLLNSLNRGIGQLLVRLSIDFLDFLQVVQTNVLIAIGLEDVTSNLTSFEAGRMDEVTVLTASAAIWSMVVAAGNRTEVAGLDELVSLEHGLLSGHLVELGQLDPFLLIDLLEFDDLFIGERDQYLRGLTWSLLK